MRGAEGRARRQRLRQAAKTDGEDDSCFCSLFFLVATGLTGEVTLPVRVTEAARIVSPVHHRFAAVRQFTGGLPRKRHPLSPVAARGWRHSNGSRSKRGTDRVS